MNILGASTKKKNLFVSSGVDVSKGAILYKKKPSGPRNQAENIAWME